MTRFILGTLLAILISSAHAASVSLAWSASTDNVGVTGYDVFRNGSKIGTAPSNSYTDTTAADGTQYSYTVQAFDAAGNRSGTSTPAIIKTGTIIIVPGGVEDHVFTPLHTFYMAPTTASPAGNDGNAGTFAAPWATPNHAGLVCGDIILAQPGTYSSSFGMTQNPGSCPSSSGGIDGSGGIYFVTVLCAGNVGTCIQSGTTTNANINIAASNWSFQGWLSNPGNATNSFIWDSSASGTTIRHHIGLINNITVNSKQGFGGNDAAANHNVPGNGADYLAVIGNIAQNSAQNVAGICVAAMDLVGVTNSDSNAGTHMYWAGNVSFANLNTCASDVEAYMFDTLDAHGYTGQIVFKDNIGYTSAREGLELTNQVLNVSQPPIYIYQNTFYGDMAVAQDNDTGGMGEINAQVSGGGNVWNWPTQIYNNISRTGFNNQGGSAGFKIPVAFLLGGTYPEIVTGGTGKENVFWAIAHTCPNFGPLCDAGNNVAQYGGGANNLGTNFYVDPAFKSTSDLLSRHVGVPSCAGFETTVACMGWDNASRVIAPQSVIDDLTPTCGSQCTGKGFQVPQPCAADTLYPAYLKGIVYLHASSYANGATITQKAGLISKPCNM